MHRNSTRHDIDRKYSAFTRTMSENALAKLYDTLNRTHFGGRLPAVRPAWRHVGGVVASTRARAPEEPTIWMSPIFLNGARPSRLRRVLLHEMTHVEVGLDLDLGPGVEVDPNAVIAEFDHGPRWREAMTRLIAQGESWAAEDVRQMSERAAEIDRVSVRIVREIERLDPTLDWPDAADILLKRFARSRRTPQWRIHARDVIVLHPRVCLAWHLRQSEARRVRPTRSDGEYGHVE
jgi:hypothetical protein